MAEAATRAESQGVHYLELLTTFQFGAVQTLSSQVDLSDGFAASREALLAAGIDDVATAAGTDIDAIQAQFDEELRCGTERAADACELPIRFDYQGLRGMPPEFVFTQLVLAFELIGSDPRVVGVNLVQPEDSFVALRDYGLQMRMIRYLRGVYEGEHVTLHAGELAPGLVPPSDLDFHINRAVRVAGAERIGHGVSIRREHGAKQLLRRMARRDIVAEQCLTSNEQVLGISGRRHSFPVYLRFGVPIALCTDDEGVSRTDLTEQYAMATREYDLSYAELKRISRDSLEYGFLQPAAKREAQRRARGGLPPLRAALRRLGETGVEEDDGFVCVIEARIHVEESNSLKSKRKVIRSLKDSVRKRFGASVAEVGGQDTWQRSTLLIAIAGGEEAAGRAEEIERYIAARVPDGAVFERFVRSVDELRD